MQPGIKYFLSESVDSKSITSIQWAVTLNWLENAYSRSLL